MKSEAIVRQKKEKKKSGHGPQRVPDTKTDRPTDRRSQPHLKHYAMKVYGGVDV
jgi:hypothetical protein